MLALLLVMCGVICAGAGGSLRDVEGNRVGEVGRGVEGPQMGNSIETRGKAKYLGGVGTKVTGITRRQFRPNLQKVRTALPNGGTKSMKVCVQCIRSGAVRKTVKQKPFSLPTK